MRYLLFNKLIKHNIKFRQKDIISKEQHKEVLQELQNYETLNQKRYLVESSQTQFTDFHSNINSRIQTILEQQKLGLKNFSIPKTSTSDLATYDNQGNILQLFEIKCRTVSIPWREEYIINLTEKYNNKTLLLDISQLPSDQIIAQFNVVSNNEYLLNYFWQQKIIFITENSVNISNLVNIYQ